jgi:glycosyltransferase involved in cell wall biosynthesis
LVQLLQGHASIEVVTGAYELHEKVSMKGIATNEVTMDNGVKVTYLTRESSKRAKWRERLSGAHKPDAVYLNSLYSLPFALWPLWEAKRLGIRVTLAPRGMLGPGSLAIKPLKKKVFLWVAKRFGWFLDVLWHASTELEKQDILSHFPQADVAIASNVPTPPLPELLPLPPSGETSPLKLLVLGRIHPIKNVDFALAALTGMSGMKRKVEVELVGPAEDADCLKRLLGYQSPWVSVVHSGAVAPHELGAVWERNHALLMPSRHENFGHAVVEAWAHGRPVLLSDRTPWSGLRAQHLGMDLPLEEQAWQDAVTDMMCWDDQHWDRVQAACRSQHLALVSSPDLLQANLALFD